MEIYFHETLLQPQRRSYGRHRHRVVALLWVSGDVKSYRLVERYSLISLITSVIEGFSVGMTWFGRCL